MPFEYGKINWDDIRLFLAVAKAGGLTAAVPETGLSAPTLNRRITAFENALAVRLFMREADLAVRNVLPTQQGLARCRIGRVDFAIYASSGYLAAHPEAQTPEQVMTCDWVVPTPVAATGASTRWLFQNLERPASVTCDTPHALIEAVCNGAGQCVLPCFVGEAEARLQRCSDAIEGLGHTQWLVSHDVSRKERPTKRVADALYDVFARDLALFVL